MLTALQRDKTTAYLIFSIKITPIPLQWKYVDLDDDHQSHFVYHHQLVSLYDFTFRPIT